MSPDPLRRAIVQAGADSLFSQEDILQLAVRLPVLLLALTLHEFGHAYSAYRLGDPTAYRLGRCTLNPLAHLDLMGTICLLFAPIGWAKPVPVNPLNFRRPGRDDIIVTAAGPATNVVQALLFGLLLRLVNAYPERIVGFWGEDGLEAVLTMFYMGVIINVGLAVFNMIPAYPLDGFHIFGNLMRDGDAKRRFQETASMGPFIIVGVVLLESFTSLRPLSGTILPVASWVFRHVAGLGG